MKAPKPQALVLCEKSGSVRDALRRCGWDAYSLDTKPEDFPSPYHIEADLNELFGTDFFGDHDNPVFDLIIAHPPCQYLSVVGHNTTPDEKKQERAQKTDEAIDFVRKIMALPCKYMAIENPKSLISSRIRPSDQLIQPYQFGHDAKKGTCLWLKNLPKLRPTNIVDGREARVHKMPPGPDRWKERSRTFEGVAEAMADQWGDFEFRLEAAE